MEFDELLKELGGCGRYQKCLFIMISLLCIPQAFNNMVMVFLVGVPDHWCHVPALEPFNLTLEETQDVR